jgi:hypothetical protein
MRKFAFENSGLTVGHLARKTFLFLNPNTSGAISICGVSQFAFAYITSSGDGGDAN